MSAIPLRLQRFARPFDTKSFRSDGKTVTSRLRLACDSWWSEEATATENDLEGRVRNLAHASTVSGIDDRSRRRRPRCTLIDLSASPRISILGDLRLTFPRRPISITRHVLVTRAEAPLFMRRPLLSWKLKNSSAENLIVFIPNVESGLRVSQRIGLAEKNGRGWTQPALAPFLIRASTSITRETARGFYLLLPAQTQKEVTLTLNRDVWCMVDFDAGFTTAIAVTADRPVVLQSLSMDIGADRFLEISGGELDSLDRDENPPEEPLLPSELLLEPSPDLPVLRETADVSTIRSLPLLPWRNCQSGDHFTIDHQEIEY